MSDNQPIESLRARRSVFPEAASHDELMSALEAAKTGTAPDVALALMREILTRLDKGDRSILPCLENWVAFCFRRILNENVRAGQAFGIEPERGKYEREDTFARNIMAVAFYILARRSGKNRTEAIGDAANRFFPDGTGEKAIEEALSQPKESVTSLYKTLDLLPSESLQTMLS